MRAPSLVVALVCLVLSLGLGGDAFAQSELEINNRTVTEGNAGSADAVLTVTLKAAASGVVTVNFATENQTAVGGATCGGTTDYITESGTVRFDPPQVSQPIGIAVCGDALVESQEVFKVRLSNANGATIKEAVGRVTINDNDVAAPPPALSINDATATEGNTGTTSRQFNVTLSAASSQVTVQFAFAATPTTPATRGTACGAGIDVALPASGTLTFAPSGTTQAIPIPFTVCGDVVDEADETFDVVLSNPTGGATLADGTGRGTITNDDLPPDRPDLTVDISQAGAATEIPTSTNVAFAVTVSNVRAGQANNVLVSVIIPTAFTSLSSSPECTFGGNTAAGNTASCTTPSLSGNTQKTFRIAGTAPRTISRSPQPFTLTAQADPNSTVGETNEGNNSDNLTINVVTRADLDVDLPSPPGQDLTTQVAPNLVYLADVDNNGNGAAPNLLVRFTLPKDVEFVRVEDNTLGTCDQNSTASNGALNVNCTLTSLPAGARRGVRIIGKVLGGVPDRVQVTFAANVDPNNSVPERNETDNTAFMITTLRAPSDVQVSPGTVTKTRLSFLAVDHCFIPFCESRELVVVEVRFAVRNNGPYRSLATSVGAVWTGGVTDLAGACAPGFVFDPPSRACVASGAASFCFRTCFVRALNPTEAVTVVLTGVIPATSSARTVVVTATVDPNLTLFDPNIGNNTVASSLTAP